MQIEMWSIDRVKPYDKNPRINDAAVDAVARSLQEFGWRQPIVVDEDGVIIVGHTRYKAALKLGYTEVPVHVAVGLRTLQHQLPAPNIFFRIDSFAYTFRVFRLVPHGSYGGKLAIVSKGAVTF